MPVVVSGSNRQGGVYRAVREAMERDAQLHAERIAGWPVDPKGPPYPLQRILDALRAGKPTDAPTWAVPAAHVGCLAARRRAGETTPGQTFYKAVVRPDDTVTFEPDDGSASIEYLGL